MPKESEKRLSVEDASIFIGGMFPYIASTEGQVGTHSVTFNVIGSDGTSASFTVRYTILGEFYILISGSKLS